MRAFEADRVAHRTRDLNAYDQFHLLRSLQPILPAVLALDLAENGIDAGTVTGALSGIDPSEISGAFAAAAKAVERRDGEEWGPGTKAVPLPDMLMIVLAVAEDNFAAYFARNRPEFTPAMGRRQDFDPVMMPDGESWLFRPCLSDPPLIEMLALYDGSAKLDHVAKANDLLDVQSENDHRAMKAAERKP